MAKKSTSLTYADFIPVKVGGTRRYYSPSQGGPLTKANTISVRAFQTAAHGGETYEQRQKKAPKPPTGQKLDYKAKVEAYQRSVNKGAQKLGLPQMSKQQVQQDPLFKQHYQEYKKHRRDKDMSSKGKFAQILVDLGLRDESWDWDVGDTPDNV